jgi:hypothetical protein
MDPYLDWLRKKDAPLFEAGGNWWTSYREALVPASAKPEPVDLELVQARKLLKQSGKLFLRHFTRRFSEPTDFWYTACNQYEPQSLSRKVRNQIRRAYKSCVVRRTDPVWLAENAYDCYTAAFARYHNQIPQPKQAFETNLLRDIGGPFEFWAVFVEERLAGYSKCVVGPDYAVTTVFLLDPSYFNFYPAYALIDTILRTYVAEGGKTLSNGFKSVSHDTNMHGFLLKFGYRNVFCDLRIVYRPALDVCVKCIFPMKAIIDRIPDTHLTFGVKALLKQEEIRRSFLQH